MRSQKTKYFVAIILVAVTIYLGFTKVFAASEPMVLDFSKSRKIENIPWVHQGARRTLIHDYNCRLTVRFDADHSFQGDVMWVSLTEKDGLVTGINIALPKLTAKDTYKTALQMAKDWKLGSDRLDKLHKWYKQDLAGHHNLVSLIDNSLPLHPSIEIVSSYNDEKPYGIDYSIFW
jgi:hypothetical protein